MLKIKNNRRLTLHLNDVLLNQIKLKAIEKKVSVSSYIRNLFEQDLKINITE